MIIANWKCNGSKAMIKDWFISYANKIKNSEINVGTVGIAPPSIFFNEVFNQIKKNNLDIFTCSQDIAGSTRKCTGAISSEMLQQSHAFSFCIVGHSERRTLYNEDNKIILDKIIECLKSHINPILCVGETEEENKLGKTKEIIQDQLSILNSLDITDKTSIAYEPIWAIGTGKTPDPSKVNEIHKFIKDVVQSNSINQHKPKVLYGGSVTEKNAYSFFKSEHVDGALVGGASLSGAIFAEIVNIKNDIKI